MNKNKVIKVLTLGTVGGVVVASSVVLGKKYKLQKEYKDYQVVDAFSNVYNEDNNEVLDKDYLSSLFIKEDILNFIDVMSSNNSSIDLNNFYRNLNSLKIDNRCIEKINCITGERLAAYYIPGFNTLVIDGEDYKNYINHELLHISVNRNNIDDSISCGFL